MLRIPASVGLPATTQELKPSSRLYITVVLGSTPDIAAAVPAVLLASPMVQYLHRDRGDSGKECQA